MPVPPNAHVVFLKTPKMATCVFRYRFNLKHFTSRLIQHKAFWQSQQGSQAKASHGKKFAFPMTSRLLSAPGIASGMLPAQGRGCDFGYGLSGSHVRPGAPNLDWEKRCFWKVKRGKATRGGKDPIGTSLGASHPTRGGSPCVPPTYPATGPRPCPAAWRRAERSQRRGLRCQLAGTLLSAPCSGGEGRRDTN